MLKEGCRVGIPWLHSACGVCEYCLTRWETLCPKPQNTGYSVDGGYADDAVAPAAFAARIPDRSGSTVGTRKELEEALDFATRGCVKSAIEVQPLGAINDVFARLKVGGVRGCVVLEVA
jgi:D-arabinose 1-dehydrogenase-like Zn-dependent alcohol dehydrogenase